MLLGLFRGNDKYEVWWSQTLLTKGKDTVLFRIKVVRSHMGCLFFSFTWKADYHQNFSDLFGRP